LWDNPVATIQIAPPAFVSANSTAKLASLNTMVLANFFLLEVLVLKILSAPRVFARQTQTNASVFHKVIGALALLNVVSTFILAKRLK